MTNTSQKVKDIQLAVWMSKTPEERLLTFLKDNEIMYMIWKQHQEKNKENRADSIIPPEQ